jgi:hypothetical protein
LKRLRSKSATQITIVEKIWFGSAEAILCLYYKHFLAQFRLLHKIASPAFGGIAMTVHARQLIGGDTANPKATIGGDTANPKATIGGDRPTPKQQSKHSHCEKERI